MSQSSPTLSYVREEQEMLLVGYKASEIKTIFLWFSLYGIRVASMQEARSIHNITGRPSNEFQVNLNLIVTYRSLSGLPRTMWTLREKISGTQAGTSTLQTEAAREKLYDPR